ncbi:MAG TPA: response regulator [Vicinamibacterales bacterium]
MVTGSVLVVDDSPETLHMLARALDAEGLHVRTANSVFRALEVLHDGSERPSVIITDLMMPQTTGWDFLKHLRGEAALQGVPIVVVTGAEPGDGDDLADVVLRKPIDPGEVATVVRGLLARSQPH